MEHVEMDDDEDYLQALLLTDPVSQPEYEESLAEGTVLHRARFKELERNFLNYETLQWILISSLLILAWGVGVILLLYTPIRRYVMRQDFRSRELYVTSDAIIYKVTKPAFLPWLGVSKTEKCIFLSLITDIVLEQGCLQSIFGLHSIRIETLGQGRALTAYNIHICGMTDPREFRKVVLTAATSMTHEESLLTRRCSSQNDSMILGLNRLHSHGGSHQVLRQASSYYSTGVDSYLMFSGEQVLKKLEDIKIYVKKIEALVERYQGRVSDVLSEVSDIDNQV